MADGGEMLRRRFQYRILLVLLMLFTGSWVFLGTPKNQPHSLLLHNNSVADISVPSNWRGLTDEQVSNMSVLGQILFLNESLRPPMQKREFSILVWKFGKDLERRHIRRFGNKEYSPWDGCPVNNCHLTYSDEDLVSADAVVFHLHKTKNVNTLPNKEKRNLNQRWIFLTDESPKHTFLYGSKENKLSDYDGLFNWSMSYRMDCDVPVPYGRTVINTAASHAHQELPQKTHLVAAMGSNCAKGGNARWKYVKEMQNYIKVDVYGRCGTLKCPGHFTQDCSELKKYKFFLSFENSNCREYLTEKLWWNAYQHGAVPVIMGPSVHECKQLLPPGSYVHVSEFSRPADLARFLQYLDTSAEDYAKYHQWRKSFNILNEHGYFQTPVFHYCRICEALNYNDPKPKVYEHLTDFWNADKDCYASNYN